MGNNNIIAKHITNKIKRKIIIRLICVIIVLITYIAGGRATREDQEAVR